MPPRPIPGYTQFQGAEHTSDSGARAAGFLCLAHTLSVCVGMRALYKSRKVKACGRLSAVFNIPTPLRH